MPGALVNNLARARGSSDLQSVKGFVNAMGTHQPSSNDDGPIAEVVELVDDDPLPPPRPGITRMEVELPWRTVGRVLLTLGFLWFVNATAGVLLQIFVGLLFAAALFPLVWRLEHRGLNRGASVIIVLFGTLGGLGLITAAVAPPLVQEASDFWENVPMYARDSLGFLRTREPELYNRVIRYVDTQTTADMTTTDIDIN